MGKVTPESRMLHISFIGRNNKIPCVIVHWFIGIYTSPDFTINAKQKTDAGYHLYNIMPQRQQFGLLKQKGAPKLLVNT
jgi:hypothetical protein